MNDTLKTIVGLLEGGKPELQVAAAQVLGELGSKDAAVLAALGDGVDRSPLLGRFCLDALAKIGNAAALGKLAAAVVERESLSEHAAQLLGDVGTQAHGVLAKIYPQAIGEQRMRILAVMIRDLGTSSLPTFVEALLTPDLTDAVAGLLAAERHRFDADMSRQLRDLVGDGIDESTPPATTARVLQLLAAIDATSGKQLFLKHTGPEVVPQVRTAAFRALRGVKLTPKQIKSMMELLQDPAQKPIHDAVRELLVGVDELPTGMAPTLKRMLSSRQPEQRLFAARMLRTSGGLELAKSFLKLLQHDDERFRQAARDGLVNNKQAVEPVMKLMLSTRNPDLAQACSEILTELSEHLTLKLQKTSVDKAVKLLGTNPRLGDQLLDLVLHAGGAKIVPYVTEKAVRMRRARRVAEALHLLAKVAAGNLGGDEVHYQIALTKLQVDADEAEGEGSPGNSTMGFFAVLIRNEFPLFERLKRESSVTPEMLLRVATYFSAAVGAERRFGTEALHYLAQRTKGRAGDEARMMLRSVGV